MMKKRYLILIALFCNFLLYVQAQDSEFSGKTIEFPSLDHLMITADLYLIDNAEAPFILLFHQAGWSRGAYREIAPELNALGFNCMAIDQRSGNESNAVLNETAKRARSVNGSTNYIDAFPDLQAALNYIELEFKPVKVIIWGSSYSASLAFILAQKNPQLVDGILAFSPGEYFTFEGKSIADYSREISIPVFITSAQSEKSNWEPIYQNLTSSQKMSYIPEFKGYHGSRALWSSNEGHEKYWEHVKKFLELFN